MPKTHGTGRARIAFAVARHACQERHPDREAKTLFLLDPETEDRIDAHLVERLDAFDWWTETLEKLEGIEKEQDPAGVLLSAKLITDEDLGYVGGLDLGPDDRSVLIEAAEDPAQTLRRLAAGFARSKPGELAVPYLRGWSPS